MMKTRIFAALMMILVLALSLFGCAAPQNVPEPQPSAAAPSQTAAPTATPAAPTQQPVAASAAPKYVFLFIGDGMTYSQFQCASSYLGALADAPDNDILEGGVKLNFMDFEASGSVTTYDSSSFCPDSASTATSIASGRKTYSGVINMDETKTESFTTIAERLHAEKGFKIGVISSVNLNHATPAAFYAHQPSRGNYYEIGEELIASGFEYYAGGGLLKPTGTQGDQPDLYDLAAQAGYTVAKTRAEADALTNGDKALVIGEVLADSDALPYEIDRADDQWALSAYVQKGIEVLDNDAGFFMMVEGGKVDWACHANDAGSTIHDVLALADAVDVALTFAQQHPEETLILVTGDHETGGLSIGFAGTDYDTYLDNIANQKISYAKYDEDYVAGYVENKTAFADAMNDVQSLFGLYLPQNAESAPEATLVLTDYETEELKKAYDLTLAGGFGTDADGNSLQSQQEYVDYGTYTPFSVTVTHLLNNKSGINFASYAHTGLPAAVFATGAGAEDFNGVYDNTDIYNKLAAILGL